MLAPATLRASTDTRTIEPGDTFVALRGERFDGHDFAAEAVRRGAAMLVVERPEARVAWSRHDAGREYEGGVHGARRCRSRALSTGESSRSPAAPARRRPKPFSRSLLATQYGDRVLSAPENENNEIGVSKLLLNASNDAHDVLVVEMGARHYGDVAALVEIARPQVGILTNVGDAHSRSWARASVSRRRSGRSSREVRARSSTPATPFRGGVRATLAEIAALVCRRATRRSIPSSHLEPLTAFVGDRRLVHRSGGRTAEFEIDVRVPGLHNRANLAAAIAGALELEVPLERMLPEFPSCVCRRDATIASPLEGGSTSSTTRITPTRAA